MADAERSERRGGPFLRDGADQGAGPGAVDRAVNPTAREEGRPATTSRGATPGAAGQAGSGRRGLRPAPLIFEPAAAVADPEHFFDLESLEDPAELLARATELTLAFRAATDRAVEFQAVAAAQLADPRRFDRLTTADIARRAEWTEDYTMKMVEFGRDLLSGEGLAGHP